MCCHTDPRVDSGLLKNGSGEFLHASSASFAEVRNSQTLKAVRKAMLAGEWHEQCSHCQAEELTGMKSPRRNAVEKWQSVLSADRAIRLTNSDGTLELSDFPLLSYDLRLGNVCNLKCRMCGPMDSRFWYSDYQKLYKINHFKDSHGSVFFTDQKKNDPYLWFEDSFFWEELFLQKESIESLYLVGGEPLLIAEHFEFLRKLVSSGVAKNIELIYNTNLTHLDDSMISLWRNFRSVGIGVSIEGVYEVNDYIRAPSNFAIVERNLELLDHVGGNIHLWLAPTVQILNVLHLPRFVHWILEKDFRFLQTTTEGLAVFHPLHRPAVFNIQTLPRDVKTTVTKAFQTLFTELEAYRGTKHEKNLAATISYLQSLVDFMNAKDTSALLPEFLRQTRALDEIRDQNFADALPELHIMLQQSAKEKLTTPSLGSINI